MGFDPATIAAMKAFWASWGTAVTAATTVAATGVSIHQQNIAAKVTEDQAKFQAEQERVAAQGKELDRRRRLNLALAQQAAGRSASGILMSGSPMVSIEDTIAQSNLDALTIQANLANTQQTLSNRAAVAKQGAKTGTALSILETGADLSGTFS